MKKLIILVLLAALGAAAHYTRPVDAKQSFRDYLAAKLTQSDNGIVAEKWDEMQARAYADNCQYFDRFFWVTVKKGEKPVYIGAFAHWFNRDEIKKDIQDLKDKAQTQVNQLNAKKSEIEDLSKKVTTPTN